MRLLLNYVVPPRKPRFSVYYGHGSGTLSRITIDPAICHGKPCVRGLRYPVETLLELLSSGMTIDEILADYEDLERDDLLAVLAYAARRLARCATPPGGDAVKFLVDAQLPRRMTAWLTAAGGNVLHTLDLPDGNRTTDAQINDMADREQRVVVSKDADFVDAHLLRGRPAKLLLISTGNVSNRDLEATLHWYRSSRISSVSSRHSFLELGRTGLTVRG